MKVSQLLQLRLTSQQIVRPAQREPHDLVAHLGAVQAQDFYSALWSIGVRLPGSTAKDILQGIAEKQLVWTWAMRGTLHIVAAEDARWMLRLLAPHALAKARGVYRQAGLTEEIFSQSRTVLLRALRDNGQLTRKQIMELWEAAGISTGSQRGYLMLARLAQEATICLGPPDDKAQTFVLLEEWLPKATLLDHSAALAEVAKRYFTSHGPATLDDFAWWTGLTRTESRKALATAMPILNSVMVGGKEYFYRSNETNVPPPHSIRLLPGFDEYMLGYTDRSLALRDVHRHHFYTKNAVYPGTIVIDAQVEGMWKRVVSGQKMLFTLSPFRALTSTEQFEVESQCRRYSEFWGKESAIEFRESS